MSLHGHPYQRYVSVKLTHFQQGDENDGPTKSGGVESGSNREKWRAFGVDIGVNLASATSQSSCTSSSTQSQMVNDASITKTASVQESLRQQLAVLTSRVGQTREQIFNAVRLKEKTSSKSTSNTCTPSSVTTDTEIIGGGSAPPSQKRVPGKDGLSRDSAKNKRSTTSDNNIVLNKGAGSTATHQQQEAGQQISEKKTKTRARKSSTLSNAEATVTSRHSSKCATQRTLFKLPVDPATSPQRGLQVAFKEELDGSALFNDARDTLNDPNRFQVPTIFVGFATREGQTNFTISSSSRGKVHFMRGVNPELSHLEVSFLVVRWKDDVIVYSAAVGLELLVRVAEELPGVEIVTFNAPCLLLPLLSYKQGKFFTSCVSDVRLMTWMLEPSADTAEFADYDKLLQSYQQQIGLPAGLNAAECKGSKEAVSHRVFYMEPLYRMLYGRLGSHGLLPAFLKQEKRISIMCAAMKLNGFYVNLVEVDGFKARCAEKMEKLRSEARSMIPSMTNFNIQSADDCRVALYEVLKLGPNLVSKGTEGSTENNSLILTRGGKLSTSEETLRILARHHEFPRILIAYRKLAKLLQTYVVGFMEMAIPIEEGDGEFTDFSISEQGKEAIPNASDRHKAKWAKLHPNLVQEGTETGRLTSVEPNMQALPRSTQLVATHEKNNTNDADSENGNNENINGDVNAADAGGNESDGPVQEKEVSFIRRCLGVPDGYSLVSLDYEQVELRVLAHLSGDSALISVLTKSGDIHRSIAEIIFRKTSVTGEERSLAKKVVFGILYGAGPRGLAQQMGVSVEQALRVSSLFKSCFPTVDAYQRRIIDQCRSDGSVRTLSGRVRSIPDINDRVLTKRSHAERQAFNTVVQGSAADVMKLGMIAVEREVLQPHAPDVRLLLQVHDEIILSVPNHMLHSIVPAAMHAFAHPISLLVPLLVTTKVGRLLGDLEEWTVDHALGLRVPS
uniref:DNA-directed DNA polymerase n=1 Tax=Trypanosoma brucei TaxID=5691 RepID=Q8MWB5_9TRYP|nr:DNA polymerase I-like protein A [Trypanosoma brucei]